MDGVYPIGYNALNILQLEIKKKTDIKSIKKFSNRAPHLHYALVILQLLSGIKLFLYDNNRNVIV